MTTEQRWRTVLDGLLRISEQVQETYAEAAYEAGFSRKRAHQVYLGDEIAWKGEWRLVLGSSDDLATFEGRPIAGLELATDEGPEIIHLDPEDILDVKAAYVPEPF